MKRVNRAAWLVLGCGLAFHFGASDASAEVWSEDDPAPNDITELDLEDLLAAPLVESAARRRQSIEDAPAAIDVFTAEEIVRAGVTSLADLLRRVPGMFVVQTNANRFDVGLRGVSSLGNNRVLVLLNGQRLMDLDHESPAWSTMPVHVGEIESIEVLRGPGSIVYGADALSGVINITTKRPLDHPGVDGLFAAGNGYLPRVPHTIRGDLVENIGSGYATYAAATRSGKLGASLTAGWNHIPDWVAPAPSSVLRYGDYGFHSGATVDWRKDARTGLLVDFRDSRGESQHTSPNLDSALSVDSNMQSLGARFRREQIAEAATLTVATGFRRRLENTRTLVVRDILSPVSPENPLDVLTRVERVNYRGQLLTQLDVDVPQARSVFSLGAETSYQHTTQLEGGNYSQVYAAALGQGEVRLFHRPELVLNVGLRSERVDVSSDEKGDAHYARLSPRASLVAKLTGDHTVRVALASAYRMPALSEISNMASSSPLAGNGSASPPTYTTWGNFSLRPEQVRSAELGYRGRPTRWLRLDGTLYWQEVLDPVRVLRQQTPLAYENGGRQTQSGAEVGIKLQPMASFGLHAAYAYTRTRATDTDRSTGDFPAHLAQVGMNAGVRNTRFNIDFSYASAIDPLLMQRGTMGPLFTRSSSNSQLLLHARIGRQFLDDRVELFAQATNLLAPFRSRDELVQYPVGGASPIGLLVLAGLQVRESGRWGGAP